MSVLSLPVVSWSASPCRQPFCIFLRARFLRRHVSQAQTRLQLPSPFWRSLGAARLPAVVLETLLEAPPLLLRRLPAAQACVLEKGKGLGSGRLP